MKEPQEKVTTVDLGDTATIWLIRTRAKDGAIIYGVAPDDTCRIKEWGIPSGSRDAGKAHGRQRPLAHLRRRQGTPGQRPRCRRWRASSSRFTGRPALRSGPRKPRRIVVQFDADQTTAIVGMSEERNDSACAE